jgi:hypothetical protein
VAREPELQNFALPRLRRRRGEGYGWLGGRQPRNPGGGYDIESEEGLPDGTGSKATVRMRFGIYGLWVIFHFYPLGFAIELDHNRSICLAIPLCNRAVDRLQTFGASASGRTAIEHCSDRHLVCENPMLATNGLPTSRIYQ